VSVAEPLESLEEMRARAGLADCTCPFEWTEESHGFAVRMWVRVGQDPACPVHPPAPRPPEGDGSWRPVNAPAWVWDPRAQLWCPGEVLWWVRHDGRLTGLCYWWPPESPGRRYGPVPRRWLRANPDGAETTPPVAPPERPGLEDADPPL
jgi:hypothetical protein